MARHPGRPLSCEYVFARQQLLSAQPVGNVLLLGPGLPFEARLAGSQTDRFAERLNGESSLLVVHTSDVLAITSGYKGFVDPTSTKSL